MNTYKCLRALTIFLIIAGWIYSSWPRIWKEPRIPPKVELVWAQTTIDVLPNAKHANDTTGDTLSGITGDDATTEDPDTTTAVNTADNIYTVDKGAVMQLDTFDVSSIPDSSTISAAVLHLQYGAEDGYNGTNPVKYDNGGGLTTTGITPTDITGWSADLTYDLYAQGVDTKSELQNVDIEFTSNDGAGPDAIHFDYVWITVTHTPPAFSISLTTSGSVNFEALALEATEDTTSSGINDVETISVDIGPAKLEVRSTNFSDGTYSWSLGTTNGSKQVKWEFSPDGTAWTTFAVAETLYLLNSSVPQGNTQDLYLKITMPTATDSYDQYGSTVTVVASAP